MKTKMESWFTPRWGITVMNVSLNSKQHRIRTGAGTGERRDRPIHQFSSTPSALFVLLFCHAKNKVFCINDSPLFNQSLQNRDVGQGWPTTNVSKPYKTGTLANLANFFPMNRIEIRSIQIFTSFADLPERIPIGQASQLLEPEEANSL